jgi:hypothetical protein
LVGVLQQVVLFDLWHIQHGLSVVGNKSLAVSHGIVNSIDILGLNGIFDIAENRVHCSSVPQEVFEIGSCNELAIVGRLCVEDCNGSGTFKVVPFRSGRREPKCASGFCGTLATAYDFGSFVHILAWPDFLGFAAQGEVGIGNESFACSQHVVFPCVRELKSILPYVSAVWLSDLIGKDCRLGNLAEWLKFGSSMVDNSSTATLSCDEQHTQGEE